MAHRGKIARLPHSVRLELNRRLGDGVPGETLLEWLNSLPATRAVLAAEFEGKPINKQNLSKWRMGGYRDWLAEEAATKPDWKRLRQMCHDVTKLRREDHVAMRLRLEAERLQQGQNRK